MKARTWAVAELVAAFAAAVGCVLAWLSAGTTVLVPPALEGEPAKTSVEYSGPLLGLSLLLATVAGVLLVFGVAHSRRS